MGKVAQPVRPSTLMMGLFAPGMSFLHRAGLGGLACTLRYIEQAFKNGQLRKAELPGQWDGGKPPWNITETTITLDFGASEAAAEYLERLFKLAFSLKNGLIFLPGQHRIAPSAEVLAALQSGLLLTFLQHGKVRKLAKEAKAGQCDPDGEGKAVSFEFRTCEYFRHQDGNVGLTDRGGLKLGPVEVSGPLSPGAVVRHNAFPATTKIEDTPDRIIPLYFAIVGCLALSVNRGVGVLVVPEVTNLLVFASQRPHMTPTTSRECRIASAGDAVLQAQIRLRGKAMISASNLPGAYAMTFKPTPWASQQKSRVSTILIPPGDELRLNQFDIALRELPPRIAEYKVKETTGRGKQKKVSERTEYFWAESAIRPLVADNLALGRPWYSGFASLMAKVDPANNKPIREKLAFERKGLHAMIEKMKWDYDGETVLVRAVHTAISNHLGRIREDTDGKREQLSTATKNRWDRFKERLRLSLVGAKTAEQCRNALCVLFSGSVSNPELAKRWQEILPLLLADWQKARDLGLLALASHAGRTEDKKS